MKTENKVVKTIQGKVVSTKMDKTAIIEIESRHIHPIFKKITRKTKRVKIHDEKNQCKEGDIIQAIEVSPISKEKRHKLLKVVQEAK